MKDTTKGASPGPNAMQHQLDMLIEELRSARRKATRQKGQGCAELDRALARAEAIKDMLCERRYRLRHVREVMVFLSSLYALVKRLSSSTNCILPRGDACDYWVDHKKATPRQRTFSRGAFEGTRGNKNIPLFRGERQEASQLNVPAADRIVL